LADDYLQARKEEQVSRETGKKDDDKSGGRRCHRCGKLGHVAKDCRVQLVTPPQKQEKVADHSPGGKSECPKKNLKDVECYNYHREGPLFCQLSSECYVQL